MSAVNDHLGDYALTWGDTVVVELLVTINDEGRDVPVIVSGTITGATARVLILEQPLGDSTRIIRVPWAAISLLHDPVPAPPVHPADQP